MALLVLISFASSIPKAEAVISATGGTITYSGNYKIHTFTTSGTFQITSGSGTVEYLVIAGGAGGGSEGSGGRGGGGGAGGMRESSFTRGVGSYTVTVGAGGAGGVGTQAIGSNGGNSVFDTVTATGGGGGGSSVANYNGASGGSGGGGSPDGVTAGNGGAGTGGQGNNGGKGSTGAQRPSGGGGGAGAVGATSTAGVAGNGGVGVASSISGSSVFYAGGGGGAIATGTLGSGGNGGGGSGQSTSPAVACTAGTANRGGGGGGAATGNGCNGGSGIVIIRYLYIVPPDKITDLTSANLGTSTVDLLWTQPGLNGGTLTNYLINFTTPFGNPQTFRANTTNTYLNVTGLTLGTDYSFRVSALTQGGYNATGNILNITTTAASYALPPTSLVATSSSSTQINLQWVASTMQNILGYKIERQTPSGSSWATIVSNTTNTNIYYNNTGLSTNIIYNYRVSAINGTGFSTPSNTYEMTTYHLPYAVTDLTALASDFSTVALSWSVPTSFAPSITGYQVNYTIPYGLPQTIQVPNPYTTTPNAIIYNLQVGGNYSFRVAPITVHGTNASGNIYNTTTNNLFTPGDINPMVAENTDDFKIFYTRTDTNSTSLQLDVTYPNTYTLICNFQYQFARLNDTYTGLSTTVVDADNVKSTFVFNNPANDVIHVKCLDTITLDEARYIITITQFPFLDQINNMRNGTYGTYFQIGAIDGVTLMICILAMIGFNRTNPMAGIIFLVITIGVLSWFEIITYPIIMYPALALLMVWAYMSTRKDD